MNQPPKWAQELILQACLHEGKEDLPEIVWRRSLVKSSSSGTAYPEENLMVIRAGENRGDQKLVVLHELAHLIAPPGERHGALFWDIAWRLYRWAKLPIRATLATEGNYRKGAIAAYSRSRNGKASFKEER